MRKLALMVVDTWLSYLLVSLQIMASFGLIFGSVERVHAADFFCASGNVTCLIAAINSANTLAGADTINLDPGTYTLTSVDHTNEFGGEPSGLPSISSHITINGEHAATTIIQRDPGAPGFRIFPVAVGGKLTLNGLMVKGGRGPVAGGGIMNEGSLIIDRCIIEDNGFGLEGGGILNETTGTLNLTNSIVLRNDAHDGGGILNFGTAIITHSSIIDNSAEGGGGIENFGTATIQNSTISENGAHSGGGISNGGTMTIMNSTIANNVVPSVVSTGGGIRNGGTLNITNSTISGNTSGGGGGGIANFVLGGIGGIVSLQNSIVALNTTAVGTSGPDCAGVVTSLGNNIIGIDAISLNPCDISLRPSDLIGDPGLGTFTDDETQGGGYFPLLKTSQAINAGNNTVCLANRLLATDQIGLPRAGVCDIGAIEFQTRMLVSVDIRPKKDANRINPNSAKGINVAILSVNGFDATSVVANTVRFGATGIEAAPIHATIRDVNGDGDPDVVLQFAIQDTGIICGDTFASLTGETSQGVSIIGSSPIKTVQCGKQR